MLPGKLRVTAAALVAAVLGVVLLSRAAADDKTDEKPPTGKDLSQRIKEAEEELNRLRQARLKELEDDLKKADEASARAREDFTKAAKGNDQDALRKAQEDLRKTGEQRSKLFQERSQLESRIRLTTPTPPPLRTEEQRLGMTSVTPNPTLAEQLGLPEKQGRVVERVDKESPAGKAGLQPHDVLLEVEGKPVPSDQLGYRRFLADLKTETPLEATVLRHNKKETLKGLTLPPAK